MDKNLIFKWNPFLMFGEAPAAARFKHAPTRVKQVKILEAEVKSFDEKDLTVEHFISSERQDRGGDIMRADGMSMSGRPVVLLAHGRTAMGPEPIAKPLWIKPGSFKSRKGIMAKTQFFPDDVGRRLWEKTTQGYMPNWSIGYIALEWKDIDRGAGRDVTKWELLEYSPVGVPMNPDAQTPKEGASELSFKLFTEESQEVPKCECHGEPMDLKTGGKDGAAYKWYECSKKDDEEDEVQHWPPAPKFFEAIGELVGEQVVRWGEQNGVRVRASETWEMKPYPNEHACRVQDPEKFARIRRENDKFGAGIDAIWGITKDEKVELQAIRFDAKKFDADAAKKWCADHKHKCSPFEPATGKDAGSIYVVEAKLDESLGSIRALIDSVKTAVDGVVTKLAEEGQRVDALFKDVDARFSALPGAEKEGEHEKNPPEQAVKRLVFVNDDAARARTVSVVRECVANVLGDQAKAQINKLRGKVD